MWTGCPDWKLSAAMLLTLTSYYGGWLVKFYSRHTAWNHPKLWTICVVLSGLSLLFTPRYFRYFIFCHFLSGGRPTYFPGHSSGDLSVLPLSLTQSASLSSSHPLFHYKKVSCCFVIVSVFSLSSVSLFFSSCIFLSFLNNNIAHSNLLYWQ